MPKARRGGAIPRSAADPKGAHRLKARERALQALDLRKAGMSYSQIGKVIGMTKMGVSRAVSEILRTTAQEPADEVRQLEVERLDTLLRGVWPKAVAGDVHSVDRVLKIIERRSAILGLDAPVKNEFSGPGGGPIPSVTVGVSVRADLPPLTPERLTEMLGLIEKHRLMDWIRPRMEASALEIQKEQEQKEGAADGTGQVERPAGA